MFAKILDGMLSISYTKNWMWKPVVVNKDNMTFYLNFIEI